MKSKTDELNRFALKQLEGKGLELRERFAIASLDDNYSVVVEPSVVNVPGKGHRLDVYVGIDSIRHNRLIRRCTAGIDALSTKTRMDADSLWFPYFTYGVYSGYFWSGADVGIWLDKGEPEAKRLIEDHMGLTVREAVPGMSGFASDRGLYGFVRNFIRPGEPWEMACAICACFAGKPEDAVNMYTMNLKVLSGPDKEKHATFWSRLSREISDCSWQS